MRRSRSAPIVSDYVIDCEECGQEMNEYDDPDLGRVFCCSNPGCGYDLPAWEVYGNDFYPWETERL